MSKISLRYVKDTLPGIRRQKKGDCFIYLSQNGKRLTSPRLLNRITHLAIPPAYTDVWICPYENGHLQATARDAKRRKQYFYHPNWIIAQEMNKFHRVYLFGKSLASIRKKVTHDLKQSGLPKEKVLAALMRIMDKTYVRVGNDVYAKEHNTFGLTTLRKRHVRVYRDQVSLSFEGKNQTPWHIQLQDPKIVKIIKKCTDIPGYELFKYMDEEGKPRIVCSEDFNEYLQNISGHDFTAKDFRTWAACKETFCLLVSFVRSEDIIDSEKALRGMLKSVACMMGHTLAICKKSYIHPLLLKSWKSGSLQKWIQNKSLPQGEKLFLKWWKEHIKEDKVAF